MMKEKLESLVVVYTLIISLIEKIRVVIVATLKVMKKIIKFNNIKLEKIDFCLARKLR